MFRRFLVSVLLLALFVSGCSSPTETPDPYQNVLNDTLTEAYRPYFPTATKEFTIKHPLGYTKTPTPTTTATETPTLFISPTMTSSPTATFTPSPTQEIYPNGTPVWPVTCYDRGDIWVEVRGNDNASYTSKCLPVLKEKGNISFSVIFDKEKFDGEDPNTIYLGGKGNYQWPYSLSTTYADFDHGHYSLWGTCDDKCKFKIVFENNELQNSMLLDEFYVEQYGKFCHEFDIPYFDYKHATISIDQTDDIGGGSLFEATYSHNVTCDQVAEDKD